MRPHFCTDLTRRIQKIGYALEVATRYAVYITYLVVVICAIMGASCVPEQQENESNNHSGRRIAAPGISTLLSAHYYALRH